MGETHLNIPPPAEADQESTFGRVAERTVVSVLGIDIDAINQADAVERIARWIETDQREYVTCTNVHAVMEAQDDPEVRIALRDAGMVTPDGVPLVWCGQQAGSDRIQRVYGPDLTLAVLEKAAQEGWSSFFFGGGDGVAERLAAEMQDRYPGLEVAGTYSPPFRDLTEAEDLEIAAMLNDSKADIIWVGLGCPKQEKWMREQRPNLKAAVLLGVGAAFDFHTGKVSQAPSAMQRVGLEWFYRLCSEPRRLWKRYLVLNPRFVRSVAADRPALKTRELI